MNTIGTVLGVLICIGIVILGMSCIIVGSRREQEFREAVVDDMNIE